MTHLATAMGPAGSITATNNKTLPNVIQSLTNKRPISTKQVAIEMATTERRPSKDIHINTSTNTSTTNNNNNDVNNNNNNNNNNNRGDDNV